MDLKRFDEKHVRATVKWGETFTGVADFYDWEYCRDEYGIEEDCVIVNEYILRTSDIASIEEIEVHGTVELRTERLILREAFKVDAGCLQQYFGAVDDDEHTYSWVMDYEDVLIGTIEAGNYQDGRIETRFCVREGWQRRGYATEALQTVLEYLTQNEGFACVRACCAPANIAAKRVLEKAGMRLVQTENDDIGDIGGRAGDILTYEYRGE